LAASPTEQTLIALSAPANTIYAYRWADIDGRRLLSAWGDWTIDSAFNIVGADFIGSTLYLVLDRPTFGVHLEKIDLSPQAFATGATFKVRLDGLLTKAQLPTPTYDVPTGRSTITLPFNPTGIPLAVVSWPDANFPAMLTHAEVSRSTTTLVVEGDLRTVPFFVGRPYRYLYRFSPFFAREGEGQNGVPRRDGRLQVSDLGIELVPPYYVVASVQNEGRAPWVSTYTAYTSEIMDDDSLTNGNKAAFIRFRVAAQNTRTTIELTNDTHLPCKMLTAQWRGQFNPRTRPL